MKGANNLHHPCFHRAKCYLRTYLRYPTGPSWLGSPPQSPRASVRRQPRYFSLLSLRSPVSTESCRWSLLPFDLLSIGDDRKYIHEHRVNRRRNINLPITRVRCSTSFQFFFFFFFFFLSYEVNEKFVHSLVRDTVFFLLCISFEEHLLIRGKSDRGLQNTWFNFKKCRTEKLIVKFVVKSLYLCVAVRVWYRCIDLICREYL